MALYEEIGNVNIWWFPQDFCQSRFGEYQRSGTNSCTLISLILADKVSKAIGFFQCVNELPPLAWDIIGNAINDGNNVYHDLIAPNSNINIPDAIETIRSHQKINFRLEEWFFTQINADPGNPMFVSLELSRIFHTSVRVFKDAEGWDLPTHLFAAIVADCRTVLVIIDIHTNIVGFCDSHQHGSEAGAVYAQTTIQNMSDLMFWFVNMLDNIFASHPLIFEISFLSSMPDLAARIPPCPEQFAIEINQTVSDASEPIS